LVFFLKRLGSPATVAHTDLISSATPSERFVVITVQDGAYPALAALHHASTE
jgi:hypothetical protein